MEGHRHRPQNPNRSRAGFRRRRKRQRPTAAAAAGTNDIMNGDICNSNSYKGSIGTGTGIGTAAYTDDDANSNSSKIFEFTEDGHSHETHNRTRGARNHSPCKPLPALIPVRVAVRIPNRNSHIDDTQYSSKISNKYKKKRSYVCNDTVCSDGDLSKTSGGHNQRGGNDNLCSIRKDTSLPGLLHLREIGFIRNPYHLCRTLRQNQQQQEDEDGDEDEDDHKKVRSNIKSQSTHTRTSIDTNSIISSKWNSRENNSKWRKFFSRKIPFSMLKTPLTDAVLGMDRSGSFLIAVGDGRAPLSSLPSSSMLSSEVCWSDGNGTVRNISFVEGNSVNEGDHHVTSNSNTNSLTDEEEEYGNENNCERQGYQQFHEQRYNLIPLLSLRFYGKCLPIPSRVHEDLRGRFVLSYVWFKAIYACIISI